jgi:hypothetical protein
MLQQIARCGEHAAPGRRRGWVRDDSVKAKEEAESPPLQKAQGWGTRKPKAKTETEAKTETKTKTNTEIKTNSETNSTTYSNGDATLG